MHMNGYRCFACGAVQSADFAGFQCPVCGGNLDITYDYNAIAQDLTGGFESDCYDLFRYRKLLPVETPEAHFPLRIGGTPLYRASRLGLQAGLHKLYLKDDSCNPSASFKDRATAVALCRAISAGATVVSAASTGNAGSSLACLAAALGLNSVVFVPENAPAAKLSQTLSFGARVLAVRGSYDEAYDLCLLASEEFGWFNRSTGYNPFTREGKKTAAFEIWEDLGRQVPDRVVVASGDGNILSGIWKGWRDLQAAGFIERLPKIDCVQSEASAAITRTVKRLRREREPPSDWSQIAVDEVQATTIADSISVDRPRDGLAAVQAVIQSGGEAVAVGDTEILSAVVEIAQTTGVFAEPAAAAPWAAVKRMAENKALELEELVVMVVTGSGLKDSSFAAEAASGLKVIDLSLDAVAVATDFPNPT